MNALTSAQSPEALALPELRSASCLAEASEGIGRELGQGQLVGTILEYEAGTVLLHSVGSEALLAVLVNDPGALGKVRYYVRKTVPELAKAL